MSHLLRNIKVRYLYTPIVIEKNEIDLPYLDFSYIYIYIVICLKNWQCSKQNYVIIWFLCQERSITFNVFRNTGIEKKNIWFYYDMNEIIGNNLFHVVTYNVVHFIRFFLLTWQSQHQLLVSPAVYMETWLPLLASKSSLTLILL